MEDLFRFLCGTNSANVVDRVAFWTLTIAFATIALFLIAWYQLLGLRKISKADFINKFTDGFFNVETQKLILLLNYNALEFKVKEIIYDDDKPIDEFPFFRINNEIIKQLPIDEMTKKTLLEKETYSSFEIDDLLLGYFEDIGCFEKDDLIRIKGVYDGFDWYIQTAWTNSAITEYIKYSRGAENDGSDIYENFEYIYLKDKSFSESKLRRGSIWFWKFRWRLSNNILKR